MKQWWHNLPLRQRLAVLYSGLLALLLGLLGFGFYIDIQQFLFSSTELRIRAQAKPVIERYVFTLVDPVTRLPYIAQQLSRDLTSRDTTALVFDREGRLLANGRKLPEEPVAIPVSADYLALALSGDNNVTIIQQVGEQHMLSLLIPLRTAPASSEILGVVQMTTPLTMIEMTLQRQGFTILFGVIMMLVVGIIVGYWLTSSTLRPLNDLIVACRNIAQGNLQQRVPVVAPYDEVGQLTAAFAEMVEQLEKNFQAQQRFIADAAHEMRTPLTALRSGLEVLLRGAQDDPQTAFRLIQSMYRDVVRLCGVSEQLLDRARYESGRALMLRLVAIAEMMEEFAAQARLLVGERTLIIAHGPAVSALIDSDGIKQALFHLIDNAIQHTTPQGEIRLGWSVERGVVQFWVADNGEGIAEADLPHVFTPFYRGSRSRSRRTGRAGLGLTLVQSVARAHGGEVTITSRLGEGTQVVIAIPYRVE
ncbi:MAG: two-component sensor histidine kinase [Chloroflexus sp.]|uniref:sensor histidine kinase n=1 Tax=Chloroflexus sp. TaxID=1904827 RepID=UPI0021DD4686|nr:HAMP domain-containing sensor histidine kinase [Chloroflexus sp.]GIV87523.1 MAG: two-component sensor histidine kinase [Chloroflexus sp.]